MVMLKMRFVLETEKAEPNSKNVFYLWCEHLSISGIYTHLSPAGALTLANFALGTYLRHQKYFLNVFENVNY